MSKLFSEVLSHTIFRHSFITAILFILALSVFTPSSVFASHEVDCGAGGVGDNCTLTFNATEGGSDPVDQTFIFRDSPTCSGTSASSETWLTVSPTPIFADTDPPWDTTLSPDELEFTIITFIQFLF